MVNSSFKTLSVKKTLLCPYCTDASKSKWNTQQLGQDYAVLTLNSPNMSQCAGIISGGCVKSDHYFLLHINDGCYFMKREMPEGLLLLSSFMNDGKSRPVYIKYNLFWYECKWPNFKKNIYNFCTGLRLLPCLPCHYLQPSLEWAISLSLSYISLYSYIGIYFYFTILLNFPIWFWHSKEKNALVYYVIPWVYIEKKPCKRWLLLFLLDYRSDIAMLLN